MTLCHILRKFIAISLITFEEYMKYLLLTFLSLCFFVTAAQTDSSGILHGNILDEKKKALEGATVTLVSLKDSNFRKIILSDADGEFTFENIQFGYYWLAFSHVNTAPLKIDSIHFRAERSDFNLSDIVLKPRSSENLDEVIVYAEKPLVQTKDGNITFNAGESALSAGSNASDLLGNVPLVTKDPDGKILVRGKEPKILIDDKPVELNQQQLQDLLESLPGSSIEKIEVMTNPPPQFANEPGGVINITTKKGKVGKSGRINLSAGSRGEASLNGNFNYRKKGFSFSINAGAGFNQFRSEGYAVRENYNTAGIKSFRTESRSKNENVRPNIRTNIDYEFSKQHAINFTTQLNANQFDNRSQTLFLPSYQMSDRRIFSTGESYNAQVNFTYTYKTKRPGEVLRWFSNINLSSNKNDREFNQEFLNRDFSFNGIDSLQQQFFNNKTNSFNNRVSYDAPIKNKKTFVSLGGFWNVSRSSIENDAIYRRYTDRKLMPLTALINTFHFHQDVINIRGSFRHAWSRYFSITAGVAAEQTNFTFDALSKNLKSQNNYWSLLPFATVSKNWKDQYSATASYKRVIRRPGMNELTPIVDSSDLFHLRTGNPDLVPSLTHNIDLVIGKTKKGFFANIGLGYHLVEDVFNQLRTRINDSTTLIQWQNSSSKQEYSISSWNGLTLNKKTKLNFSASYTYNVFSGFDKETRGFKNGGTLTSNLNSNYLINDLYNVTGSFTFNRFANPQGTARSNLSMNFGLQAKIWSKKLTLTLNVIDPLREQQNRNFTFGNNFTIENFNATRSRNFRLSAAYNFIAPQKKKADPKINKQLQQAIKKVKS